MTIFIDCRKDGWIKNTFPLSESTNYNIIMKITGSTDLETIFQYINPKDLTGLSITIVVHSIDTQQLSIFLKKCCNLVSFSFDRNYGTKYYTTTKANVNFRHIKLDITNILNNIPDTVKKLSFYCGYFSENEIQLLCQKCITNNITELTIGGSDISSGLDLLTDTLRLFNKLQYLTICFCMVGSNYIDKILWNTRLLDIKQLDIRGNIKPDEEFSTQSLDMLQHSRYKSLNISNNNLSSNNISQIYEMGILEKNNKIQELYFHTNTNKMGMDLFFLGMEKNMSITYLDVSNTNLSFCSEQIKILLSNNKSLIHLAIDNCKLSNHNMSYIIDNLPNYKTLQYLSALDNDASLCNNILLNRLLCSNLLEIKFSIHNVCLKSCITIKRFTKNIFVDIAHDFYSCNKSICPITGIPNTVGDTNFRYKIIIDAQ